MNKKNRFRTLCPRRLKTPPRIHECPFGQCKVDHMLSGRFKQDFIRKGQCQWYINHKESNYCFWRWLEENDCEHTLEEIADLLCVSINNIELRLREALKHFKKRLCNNKQSKNT